VRRVAHAIVWLVQPVAVIGILAGITVCDMGRRWLRLEARLRVRP
jgi:hypothetical protein